jgi:hypothetical protein
VKIALICDPEDSARARDLADSLAACGLDASLLELSAADSQAPGAALAHYLREVEAALGPGVFDAVALIGDGDAPFAGVLVATKAVVTSVHLAAGQSGENGALIDHLAEHVVPVDTAGATTEIARLLNFAP